MIYPYRLTRLPNAWLNEVGSRTVRCSQVNSRVLLLPGSEPFLSLPHYLKWLMAIQSSAGEVDRKHESCSTHAQVTLESLAIRGVSGAFRVF